MSNLRLAPLALLFASLLTSTASPIVAQTIDFEDLYDTIGDENYENGGNLFGGFSSGGAFFNNTYDPLYGSWSGWSYSTITDVTTPGWGNQYSAYSLPGGGGAGGSKTYALAYYAAPYIDFFSGDLVIPDLPSIQLPSGMTATSIDITNTTYAAMAILHGDPPSRAFVDGDSFILTIMGYYQGALVNSFDVDLANYNVDPHELVDDWTTVYLSSLGTFDELRFSMDTTDYNDFGLLTPTFFALDNIQFAAVPEPGSLLLSLVGAAGLWRMRKRRAKAGE